MMHQVSASMQAPSMARHFRAIRWVPRIVSKPRRASQATVAPTPMSRLQHRQDDKFGVLRVRVGEDTEWKSYMCQLKVSAVERKFRACTPAAPCTHIALALPPSHRI